MDYYFLSLVTLVGIFVRNVSGLPAGDIANPSQTEFPTSTATPISTSTSSSTPTSSLSSSSTSSDAPSSSTR